jgi:hypothetical protein
MALSKLKKISVLVLSIASVSLLASCDNVEAKLADSNYNANILVDSTGANANITNNSYGKIYDALVKSGDTNSQKVLENVLYIYAQSVYGDFYEIKAARPLMLTKARPTTSPHSKRLPMLTMSILIRRTTPIRSIRS